MSLRHHVIRLAHQNPRHSALRVALLHLLAGRLTLDGGKLREDIATQIRALKKPRLRSNGSLTESLESAGGYARKHGKNMVVYAGNSFGSAVWRVVLGDKESEFLNRINNTGSMLFVVEPDGTVKEHKIER